MRSPPLLGTRASPRSRSSTPRLQSTGESAVFPSLAAGLLSRLSAHISAPVAGVGFRQCPAHHSPVVEVQATQTVETEPCGHRWRPARCLGTLQPQPRDPRKPGRTFAGCSGPAVPLTFSGAVNPLLWREGHQTLGDQLWSDPGGTEFFHPWLRFCFCRENAVSQTGLPLPECWALWWESGRAVVASGDSDGTTGSGMGLAC